MAPFEREDVERLLAKKSQGRFRSFKDGQWRAVSVVLEETRPILLVEKTGWGKSLIYFAAALALRDRWKGLALAISPLQSLMRDQLRAARDLGLSAAAIHAGNRREWAEIETAIETDALDLLLISPERLANDDFLSKTLARLPRPPSVLIIDEAHCLSDWGHDFRPDYRRIHSLIQTIMPKGAPILAVTATANDRVVKDIEAELGPLFILRGSLERRSLALETIRLPDIAARYAWLADHAPNIPGTGIVYAHTRKGAENLAEWLREEGVNVFAYHAGLSHEERASIERKLRDNQIKAAIATSALGVGFDKPDLGFVLHLEAPLSLAHYYQEVGRAGRAIDRAYGILLGGEWDERRAFHFIQSAAPSIERMREIVDLIEETETGISLETVAESLQMEIRQAEICLRHLTMQQPSPVSFAKGRYYPVYRAWSFDSEKIDQIKRQRWSEWRDMKAYAQADRCLMQALLGSLGEEKAEPCGRCAYCRKSSMFGAKPSRSRVRRAKAYLARKGALRRYASTAQNSLWIEALKAFFRWR